MGDDGVVFFFFFFQSCQAILWSTIMFGDHRVSTCFLRDIASQNFTQTMINATWFAKSKLIIWVTFHTMNCNMSCTNRGEPSPRHNKASKRDAQELLVGWKPRWLWDTEPTIWKKKDAQLIPVLMPVFYVYIITKYEYEFHFFYLGVLLVAMVTYEYTVKNRIINK